MSYTQQRINEIIDELEVDSTPQQRAKALRDIMQAISLETPFQHVQRFRNNKLMLFLEQCSDDILKGTKHFQA